MSRDASITLPWGIDEYTFKRGIRQWQKGKGRCGAGRGEIYRRLISVAPALEQGLTLRQAAAMGMIGDWRVEDVREVIHQGLIGGGMPEVQAGVLVLRRIPDLASAKDHIALAYGIVRAGLGDVPDEPPGEKTGRAKPKVRAPSPKARSGSRASTATV